MYGMNGWHKTNQVPFSIYAYNSVFVVAVSLWWNSDHIKWKSNVFFCGHWPLAHYYSLGFWFCLYYSIWCVALLHPMSIHFGITLAGHYIHKRVRLARRIDKYMNVSFSSHIILYIHSPFAAHMCVGRPIKSTKLYSVRGHNRSVNTSKQ